MTDIRTAPQHLYRWFDSDGVLLYVGISVNAYSRASQHFQSIHSSWTDRAVRMELQNYSDRPSVEKAEKEAIKNEHPLYNVVHVAKPTSERSPLELGSWCIPGQWSDGFRRGLPYHVLGVNEAESNRIKLLTLKFSLPPVYRVSYLHPLTGDTIIRDHVFIDSDKDNFRLTGKPAPTRFESEEKWMKAVHNIDWEPNADAEWLDLLVGGGIRENDEDFSRAQNYLNQMREEYLHLSSEEQRWPRVFSSPYLGTDIRFEAIKKSWTSLESLDEDELGYLRHTVEPEILGYVDSILNQRQHDLISTRTREGMAQRKAEGATFGRVVDPAFLSTYKMVIELRQSGMSLRKISEKLNADGVPTARGMSWHPSTVVAILKSETAKNLDSSLLVPSAQVE